MSTLHMKSSKAMRQWMMSFLIAALSIIMLTGCKTIKLFEQTTVKYHEDLGSLHVTVFPPVPFDEYRKSIQPTFEITEKKALEEVVPITMHRQKLGFSGFGGSAAISMPTATGAGGMATPPALDETKRVLKPEQDSEGSEKDLGIDPFMKYWTATALYQEVQLINRYYQDLGVSDYVPYILRLQISTLPRVRNAPYDATVDLSFYLGNETSLDPKLNLKILPLLVTDNLESQLHALSVEQVRQLALALQGMVKGVGIGTRISDYQQLIRTAFGRDFNSLLTVGRVSDNILRVRLGAVQQAGSAYAMVPRTHTISVVILKPKNTKNINANSIWVASKSVFNHAITGTELPLKSKTGASRSPYYVKRVNEVLTRYNIPAMNPDQVEQILNAYNMKDMDKLGIAICGEQYNAPPNESGPSNNAQPSRPSTDSYPSPRTGPRPDWDSTLGVPLPGVESSSQPSKNVVQPSLPQCNKVDENVLRLVLSLIWLDIAHIVSDTSYDLTSIPLPPIPERKSIRIGENGFTEESQALTLFDDGKKTTVSIPNVGKPNTSHMTAQLVFDKGDNNNNEVSFMCDTLNTDQTQSGLIISFPSLAAWGVSEKKNRQLSLYWVNENGSSETLADFTKLIYKPVKEPTKPQGKISVENGNNHVAVLQDGTGKLWLRFTNIDPTREKLRLDISGARVADIQPLDIVDREKYEVMKNGEVTVKLENLVPGQKIKVSGKTADGLEREPVVLEVISPK